MVIHEGEILEGVFQPLGSLASHPAAWEVLGCVGVGRQTVLIRVREKADDREYALSFERHPEHALVLQEKIRAEAEKHLGGAPVPRGWGVFRLADGREGRIQDWVVCHARALETDERLFDRIHPPHDPDYRHPSRWNDQLTAQRFFMARLARILRDVGAAVLAPRYAWNGWLAPTRVAVRPDGSFVALDFALYPSLILFHKRSRPPVGPVERLKKAVYILIKPDARLRWMRGMLEEGLVNGTVSAVDGSRIAAQMEDPFVQLYFKCLAVHLVLLCLPFNMVCSLLFSMIYFGFLHGETWTHVVRNGGIIYATMSTVLPFSFGSIVRGAYAAWMAWRARSFRRFRIAIFVSSLRGIGYMGVPLQIVGTFPALSRFLAARAVMDIAHRVPVLGRRGGRLEQLVFDVFYNIPLYLGRRRITRSA